MSCCIAGATDWSAGLQVLTPHLSLTRHYWTTMMTTLPDGN